MKPTLFVTSLAICLWVVAPSIAFATPIEPNDLASTWSRSPSAERFAYSKKVATFCASSNCGSVEIKACMDEAFRHPMEPSMKGITIGEGAASCITILKSQR